MLKTNFMKYINKTLVTICLLVMTHITITAQAYKLPEYESFKLKNGLTVYLMEQHDVPVISLSAILPAGAIYDFDKPGISSLTATALKHGTKNFTKNQIDEELGYIGAYVNSYASKEYAGISSKFAAKDAAKVLAIIKELLLEPSFNISEFEKEKSRLLVGLEQKKESPRSVIRDYSDKFLFGNHVYGNVTDGSVASVSKLTVEDIKGFYKENYSPNEAAISVVGDFSSKEMKNVLTKLFSEWKSSNEVSNNLAPKKIVKRTSNNVLLVNKEDANETTFYIAAPGISRNNPDFVAVEVINTLFGGRFTSMLNDELRVNSGLTYGASSRFSTLKNGGAFYISTFTALENTEAAIDKTLEVLKKLHVNGINEKSLASAKNYVKGQFPPDYETTGQLASLLTKMFVYNFDESFINNFENTVDGLDLEKANKIIDTYFPKDNLQFILVGKASEIKTIAEKYGKVTQVEIKD